MLFYALMHPRHSLPPCWTSHSRPPDILPRSACASPGTFPFTQAARADCHPSFPPPPSHSTHHRRKGGGRGGVGGTLGPSPRNGSGNNPHTQNCPPLPEYLDRPKGWSGGSPARSPPLPGLAFPSSEETGGGRDQRPPTLSFPHATPHSAAFLSVPSPPLCSRLVQPGLPHSIFGNKAEAGGPEKNPANEEGRDSTRREVGSQPIEQAQEEGVQPIERQSDWKRAGPEVELGGRRKKRSSAGLGTAVSAPPSWPAACAVSRGYAARPPPRATWEVGVTWKGKRDKCLRTGSDPWTLPPPCASDPSWPPHSFASVHRAQSCAGSACASSPFPHASSPLAPPCCCHYLLLSTTFLFA